jgi:MFS family permease
VDVARLSQAGFFGFFFSIPLLLIDVWGWTTLEAGLAIAFNQFISAIVGLPAGRRSDRDGHTGVIVIGGLVAAAGYAWLALGVGAEPSVWSVLVPSFVLAGVGSMMVGGTVSAAAFHDVDDARLGRASAAYYVTRRLGSALGAIVAVAILGDRVGVDALPAFRTIWLLSAGCFLASAAVMWALFDSPLRGSRGGAPSAPAA